MKLFWRILIDYHGGWLEETWVVSTENILRIATIKPQNTLQGWEERWGTPLPAAGTVRLDKITLQWKNNLALTYITTPYKPCLAVMRLQGTKWCSEIPVTLRGKDQGREGDANLALVGFYALLIPACSKPTTRRCSNTPRFYNLSVQPQLG